MFSYSQPKPKKPYMKYIPLTDFSNVLQKIYDVSVSSVIKPHHYIYDMAGKHHYDVSGVYTAIKDVSCVYTTIKDVSCVYTNISKELDISNGKIYVSYTGHMEDISFVNIDLSMNIPPGIGIIEDSIEKIQNWNKLYTTGMQIEISEKPDTFVQSANKIIKSTTEILENVVSGLIDKYTPIE